MFKVGTNHWLQQNSPIMKSGQPNFTQNETTEGVFKGSLFKNLFKERKAIIEGYPAVKKGLSFPEQSLKFGGANYTFKSSDVVDKITAKDGDKEFIARYKKNTNLWDVSYKFNVYDGTNALVKYEERGQGGPNYVVGADTVVGMVAMNSKFQLATGVLKYSFLANLNDVVPNLNVAGDCTTNVRDMSGLKWNVGAAYRSPLGRSVVALNEEMILTANQSLSIDKKTSALLECAANIQGGKAPASPLVMGISHKLDRQHELRARVNQAGQIQCSIKKEMTPNVNLQIATCYDVNKVESFTQAPAFGFKVAFKG